ncbi:hypothetical protein POTOM_033820 [Populus tomentosa]|uniref:Uncharacterized protein n=1 Tax=Populus tomentosa TaxID=118781 RepID=A0A8X7Z117_POPTO|nr:hypothetical protein POTOM_033820 [Populus tomentosa]
MSTVKNALINLVLSEEWGELKKGRLNSSMGHGELKKVVTDDDVWEMLNITLMCIKPIWDRIRNCDSNKACIGEVEVHQKMNDLLGSPWACFPTYELTPYYYSDDWLTSLSPAGEERNKPHADPGVHQAYLNALDRLR